MMLDSETTSLDDSTLAADPPGPEGTAEHDGLDPMAVQPPDDEPDNTLEDIEHEGQTYQVPRALKGAFLRHADYTRKTQELAGERRALEEARAVDGDVLHARANLTAIEQEFEDLQQVDWDRLRREDPDGAAQLGWRLETLAAAHDELTEGLSHAQAQAAFEAEQRQLTNLHAGHVELSRDLPGWSPELADRLSDFAMREFGVTEDELEGVEDPRLVKLLHRAYLAANSGGLNRQAKRLADAQTSRPAATVNGRASAGKDPGRMTTEEWMRHRNSQIRRQR